MNRYQQQSTIAPFAMAAAAVATAATIAVAVLVPAKPGDTNEMTLATRTHDTNNQEVVARFRVDVIGYRDGRAPNANLTQARATTVTPRS